MRFGIPYFIIKQEASMSGRKENDIKNNIWIQNKLKGQPKTLSLYMQDIAEDKTSMTRRAYLGYLLQYFEYCKENDVDIINTKPMNINAYKKHLKEQGNGSKMINTKLAALISYYTFLEDNDFIEKNPCDKVKKLKINEERKIISMTSNEVDELKNGILKCSNRRNKKYHNRDLAIVTLGCSTGMRISEILNIDIDDVDFERNSIRIIAKGNKSRTIYFGNNTKNVLLRWIDDRGRIIGNSNEKALFINPQHHRISSGAIREMLKKETMELDKHITPHKMRSTYAMGLYDEVKDIYLVAQGLGHSNINNTMIYAEASEERRRMAANVMD